MTQTAEPASGRPSKLTDEVTQGVKEAILAGAPLHVAAAHARIHVATLHRYQSRGRAALDEADGDWALIPDGDRPFCDFYDAVEGARREWELGQLAVIQRAARGIPATNRDGTQAPIIEVETRITYDADGNMTGKIVTERRGVKPDWRAAMTLLERRDPESYGRTTKTEITGAGGGPLEVTTVEDLAARATEQIDELLARRERKTG